jgi:tetratricopeptide (TPR) repeat protein
LEDLGNALVRDGKLREGMENYLEAYKLNPDSADLNHEMALCYRELGQYADALKHFEKALTIRPQFPDAENNFGTLYILMGKWDLAIEHFKKAASDVLYQTPHFAYNNIGMAYAAKGNFKNAIANYQKALQYYPGFADCYKNMGIAYEGDGNLKEAINSYENAMGNSTPEDPEFSMSHFLLGRLYLKMGKKKEAKELLQKAIEIDSKAPFVGEAKKLLSSIKP